MADMPKNQTKAIKLAKPNFYRFVEMHKVDNKSKMFSYHRKINS